MGKKPKNVNKATSGAKKFEADLPEVAKRHNIRVSSPYGYYPEDVDKIILNLEKEISNLSKENKQLADEIEGKKQDISKLQKQFNDLRFQIMTGETTDTSAEEDFANLSRIGSITGKIEPQIMDKRVDGPPLMPVSVIEEPHTTQQHQVSHSNLIRPKNSNAQVKPKIKINSNKGE